MSTTTERLELAHARMIAGLMVNILTPHCQRIEIAGSIRRNQADVGDIEIVAIPKTVTSKNVLGEDVSVRDTETPGRALMLAGARYLMGKDKYQKYLLEGGTQLDLFLTTPECWGVILALRTGPSDFSARLVTAKQKGGLLPSYLHVKDGRVWRGEFALDTPEEIDFFDVMGLKWVRPEDRK